MLVGAVTHATSMPLGADSVIFLPSPVNVDVMRLNQARVVPQSIAMPSALNSNVMRNGGKRQNRGQKGPNKANKGRKGPQKGPKGSKGQKGPQRAKQDSND